MFQMTMAAAPAAAKDVYLAQLGWFEVQDREDAHRKLDNMLDIFEKQQVRDEPESEDAPKIARPISSSPYRTVEWRCPNPNCELHDRSQFLGSGNGLITWTCKKCRTPLIGVE